MSAGSSGSGSTVWPSWRIALTADSSAANVLGSTTPSLDSLIVASLSRFGLTEIASRKGLGFGGALYGSPSAGPAIASSMRATSRTVRAIGPTVERLPHPSAAAGARVIRPRDGFNPTIPQQADGIRIDPPPSLPWATGLSPAATAAPAPPLEPPAVCSRFQGFRAGGCRPASVVGRVPNSGVVVLPNRIPPELRRRIARTASAGAYQFSKFFEPIVVRMSRVHSKSLSE